MTSRRHLPVSADFSIGRRQYTRLSGHLYGTQFAADWEFISGIISDSGFIRRILGDDIRRRQ